MSDYKMPDLDRYPPLLKRFAQYKLDMDCSKNTVSDYLMDLELFFRFLYLSRAGVTDYTQIGKTDIQSLDTDFVNSVTPNEIRAFISYANTQRGNQARARARKLSSIRSFYRYLNTNYITQHNPTVNIETPKLQKTLPKFLTLEESITLLQTVQQDTASKTRQRDYAIITLFLNCGMRLSELCGIDMRDVDPKFQSLRVTGKGSKERLIYLNDACRDALQAYLRVRRDEADQIKPGHQNALFLSTRHQRISQKTVQWMVYKYLEQAGLGNRKLSTHKLRHTAATLMYQSGGVDVRVLKDILGHEQLNTTQIYTHVSDAQMKKAIDSNPLASVKSKQMQRDAPPEKKE